MGRMSEMDLDLQQINSISTIRTQPMTNHLASIYLEEMECRIEAPYRARQIIFDFSLSIALAFAIGFTLLVL